LNDILSQNNISYPDISLIKVDIEGGEEHILEQLLNMWNFHNVKLYVSFHYTWWSDKNLDRFGLLTNNNKKRIISEPFCSILFE
jgi:hypothetical protein